MYFTRDPVVETLITAREGYRLLIRSTTSTEHEEFLVDMVEVVNLGSVCFFRSLEKPKAFLIPAADYVLLEVKEQRVALKAPITVSQQKGSSKGNQKDSHRGENPPTQKHSGKKQKKQRKIAEEEEVITPPREPVEEPVMEKPLLIPPPPLLISDTISRYKEMTAIEELSLEPLPDHSDPIID